MIDGYYAGGESGSRVSFRLDQDKSDQPWVSREGNVKAGVVYFTAFHREGLLRAGFPCAKMQML